MAKAQTALSNPFSRFFPGSFRQQAVVLALIGFIFYFNSLSNGYALDDGPVIRFNEYVDQGFRGIPKIVSSDSYESFYKKMGSGQQLSGGRYRPLSAVMFAMEQQLLGSKEKVKPEEDLAFFRHLLNLLLYIFSVLVLLHFLRTYLFKGNELAPFLTCLLFLIHPVHSEVVANIKSRDEILSFLFITLTFIAVFRYKEEGRRSQLVYALLFYGLAFLSKEYAITLLLLIPLLLYLVKKESLKSSLLFTLPFALLAVLYIFARYRILGVGSAHQDQDILNAPFKYATPAEALATKIGILGKYLKLLLYPSVLSSDYSYNTIPYVNFGSLKVWASLLIHAGMIGAFVYFFRKRNILAFALAFYLLHLFLVSNFIFDIGATMGERLIYHSSFGFFLAVAVAAEAGLNKVSSLNLRNALLTSAVLLLLLFSANKVISRNPDWKNDYTLFIADVNKVPNSAFANGFAGQAYLNMAGLPENAAHAKEYTDKAFVYLQKAISIHKGYANAWLNLGAAYLYTNEYDKAKQAWEVVDSLFPGHPMLKSNYARLADTYYRVALKYGPEDKKAGVSFMEKTMALDSINPEYRRAMGEAYYNYGMSFGERQPGEARPYLEKALRYAPENPLYWYNLGGACFTLGDYEGARHAWTKTLELEPANQLAKQGLNALPKPR